MSHWHLSAAPWWRRASRLPSATASHSSRSPSQLSSSWRSAAARLVGSMRSKGPWVSSSRDRASSYTGPPVLKCATASRAAPFLGGAIVWWPRCVPMFVSPCLRARWRFEGRCRGGRALGRARTRPHSTLFVAPGPLAAIPLLPRPTGGRGPPRGHGGPRPGVRPPPLERDGGISLRGVLRGARGGAPPAPLARPLLAHYTCLPCGHGAAPDEVWEEGVLQVLRETPRQVPVWVGVLLWWALQSAIHDTEGGYEAFVRARGRGWGSCPLPQ